MDRVFIIDGNSLANRAFYALPFFTNPKGEPSGATFGFANLLVKLLTEENPDRIIVAFDHARKTFRNDLFEAYKGTRKETPKELLSQFSAIKKMLEIMKVSTFEFSGIEADDIIGSLCKQIEGKKVLISGDKDLLQLIDEQTEVWLTKKGITELKKFDRRTLQDEMGLAPCQIIDLKALMGDASDNIPGVEGVGEKTALKLVQTYADLNNIYKNIDSIKGKLKEKLIENKDIAYLSKQLATIKTDCKIKVGADEFKFPFDFEVYKFFKEMGFSSLIKRANLFIDLYGNVINSTFANRIKITSLTQVDELISKIDSQFSYSMERMEFAPNQSDLYYLETRFDMFSEEIAIEDVLKKLKSVFENPQIQKITASAKADMHVLDNYRIKLENFFDIALARYVLFAGANTQREDNGPCAYYSEKNQLENLLKEKKLENIYYDCEIPLVSVLFEMEKSGFKVDKETLTELSQDFTQKTQQLYSEIMQLAGEEFNLNSPKQTAYILFHKLGLTSYNNKKESTSAAILEEMILQHPIIEKILLFRKFNKLKTTYIDVYQRICETSGEVIHTTFQQTLTSTGRISSIDPNLQNIPTRDEYGKSLRKVFVSKFEGGEIISADYNQIELRLLADMSGEKGLIEAYMNGEDIHASTASKMFGVPQDAVSPAQRREAKAVNFGVIYGISDYGLSQSIKIPVKQAKEYIDTYFMKYPLVKTFSESNIAFAAEHGYAITKFGRIRQIPEMKSANKNIRSFGERVAMNMPLQGTASDIIKFAMIKLFERLKSLKSEIILQVHDELIIDTYPGEEEEVKTALKEVMENIAVLKVPLPISIGEGKTLYDCKD